MYRYIQKKTGSGMTGDWMFLLPYNDRQKIADWAYEGIAYCTVNEIIHGDNGNFRPKDNTTRAEAFTLLYNYETKEEK